MLHVGELPSGVLEKLEREEITGADAERFLGALERKRREIDEHPLIVKNIFTKEFKNGTANLEQVKDLVVQFSVFSNHFLVIQCKRMVNSTTEVARRGARSILANEIGVAIDMDEGDADGGTFLHKSAHLNWLMEIGDMLGIDSRTLGRWALGTEATQRFLTQLEEVYGSRDSNIGSGASFAIETWAGFGIGGNAKAESNNFWKELITGLEGFNANHRLPHGLPPVGIEFFQYHFDLESAHVANVEHELEEIFFDPDFDEEKWFEGARKALDAMHIFWLGLEETRKQLA